MRKQNEVQTDSKIVLCDTCYRNKITYLSFVLAALVVIRHTVNIEVYELSFGILFWIEKFFSELTDLAVPTFFVLSGYLFFQNYSPNILIKKWKSRLFSILIPYLIWNAIGYLYILIISMVPSFKDRMTTSIDGFNLYDFFRAIIFGEYNMVTWFLQCLIVYIIVTPILYWIIKYKLGVVITTIVLLVLLTIINKQIVNCWILYVVGACIGLHGKNFVKMKYRNSSVILSWVLLLVSVILGMIFDFQATTHQITVYTAVRLLQVIAIWICADLLAIERTPRWWMKISFFIYVCYGLILESVEKLFLITLGRNVLGATLDFVLAPIITLIFIMILAFVLRKIKPLWSVLTGSRG